MIYKKTFIILVVFLSFTNIYSLEEEYMMYEEKILNILKIVDIDTKELNIDFFEKEQSYRYGETIKFKAYYKNNKYKNRIWFDFYTKDKSIKRITPFFENKNISIKNPIKEEILFEKGVKILKQLIGEKFNKIELIKIRHSTYTPKYDSSDGTSFDFIRKYKGYLVDEGAHISFYNDGFLRGMHVGDVDLTAPINIQISREEAQKIALNFIENMINPYYTRFLPYFRKYKVKEMSKKEVDLSGYNWPGWYENMDFSNPVFIHPNYTFY